MFIIVPTIECTHCQCELIRERTPQGILFKCQHCRDAVFLTYCDMTVKGALMPHPILCEATEPKPR